MTAPRIQNRVFVVGVPRSGTTLVQSLLATHSHLISFTESHFFSRHFRNVPGTSRSMQTRDPRPRLQEFLTENGVGVALAKSLLGEIEPRGALQALRARRSTGQFVSLLDRLALERDAQGWIEKTPMHLHYLKLIEEVLEQPGEVDFVHVVRRPLDAAASLYLASRHWEREYSLEECAQRWNGDVRMSLERVGGPRDRFVFYEEIAEDPESVLETLLESLRLTPEAGMLDRYAAATGALIAPGEVWKRGFDRSIQPSRSATQELDDEHLQELDDHLDTDLYELVRERIDSSARHR